MLVTSAPITGALPQASESLFISPIRSATGALVKTIIYDAQETGQEDDLLDYLKSTAYKDQVIISDLPTIFVNDALFCTAIDNLIRNGLRYNDSDTKIVKIYMENDYLVVEDNGRGMDCNEFEYLSKPYTRKQNQKEQGTGLGLNICTAILKVHGFHISCEKNNIGTKMKIKLSKDDK